MKKIYLLFLFLLLLGCERELDISRAYIIAQGTVTNVEVLRARGFTSCTNTYYVTLNNRSKFELCCGAWRNFGPVFIGQRIEIRQWDNPGKWIIPVHLRANSK